MSLCSFCSLHARYHPFLVDAPCSLLLLLSYTSPYLLYRIPVAELLSAQVS
jgi:hypothetical protein